MTPEQFFLKVAAMRKVQCDYFRTRDSLALRKSKALEKEVDEEIERAMPFVKSKKKQPVQGNLFENENV